MASSEPELTEPDATSVPSGWAGHVGGAVGFSYGTSADVSATDFSIGESSSLGAYVAAFPQGALAVVAIDHYHLLLNERAAQLLSFGAGARFVFPTGSWISAGLGIASVIPASGMASTGIGFVADALVLDHHRHDGLLLTADIEYVAGEGNLESLWVAHVGVGFGVSR